MQTFSQDKKLNDKVKHTCIYTKIKLFVLKKIPL